MLERKLNNMLKQNKYNDKNTIQVPFRLNRRTDTDIIGFFETLKKDNISVAGYLKKIIRQDLENNKNAAEKELEKTEADDSEFYNFIKDIKEI